MSRCGRNEIPSLDVKIRPKKTIKEVLDTSVDSTSDRDNVLIKQQPMNITNSNKFDFSDIHIRKKSNNLLKSDINVNSVVKGYKVSLNSTRPDINDENDDQNNQEKKPIAHMAKPQKSILYSKLNFYIFSFILI